MEKCPITPEWYLWKISTSGVFDLWIMCYIHLKDKNQVLFLFYILFFKNVWNASDLAVDYLHVLYPGLKVPLSTTSFVCVCALLYMCVTWGKCVSLSLVPPVPQGWWSSPSPLHYFSHSWGPLETSSPQTHPPHFPPSFPPLLRPPPLLSACSKVGFQPQRISSPSHSALSSAGRHFLSGLPQTWS